MAEACRVLGEQALKEVRDCDFVHFSLFITVGEFVFE